ncbi:MAG: hypothetical protein ACJAXJ_003355 [Colwellia sp.]|jgi:hypothetical protein|tara:strand:+ start:3557 stop:4039 length:483 start_codon:yes stop_codon:yes gene_type:complete
MISSMNNSMSMPTSLKTSSSTEQGLSAEQQSLISETLSQYDVDNLTEADALNIVEAFAEAGIQPGLALEKAVSSSGFDAKSLGDLANVSEKGSRPPPPPPPQQSTEEITSMVDYLAELMEEKLAESNSNELTDEDKQSILALVFEKFDIEDGESIINTSA